VLLPPLVFPVHNIGKGKVFQHWALTKMLRNTKKTNFNVATLKKKLRYFKLGILKLCAFKRKIDLKKEIISLRSNGVIDILSLMPGRSKLECLFRQAFLYKAYILKVRLGLPLQVEYHNIS
jgi:hypothetical protein